MFFLKPKPIVSVEDCEWQLETFRWLMSEFNDSGDHQPQLVTPTRDFFPDVCESPQEVVDFTFKRVLKYAGMEGWPCVLAAQEYDVDTHVGRSVHVQNAPSGPAGTFSVAQGGQVIISFKPDLVSDIQALVATFAHELAHYKLSTFKSEPPGGHDNEEFATDLAAVFMGFGIFLTNTAFQFSQFVDHRNGSQGWKWSRQGYLSQTELVQALATFVLVFDQDAKEVEHYLRDGWISPYRKALRYLRAQDIRGKLRSS